MNQSMISAAVTMGQLQYKMDTTGHNLANLNTTGYKRRDTSFADLLFQQVNNQPVAGQEAGRLTPNGIRVGSGGAIAQTSVRFEQGTIRETGRDLDVALTEKGYFFEISPTDDGDRRFTRDGAFYLSPNPAVENENLLVNRDGEYVLSSTGTPISIPAGHEDLLIRENGIVEVTMPGGAVVNAGQLQLVEVTKPQLLSALGGSNFIFSGLEELGLEEADVMAEAAGTDVFRQKALEMSNVDMGRETAEMLLAQRNYQFNARAISIGDEMMGLVNNIR
ncbi:flagellar hook-basal body protein [Evansella clarkii]|uniref:flagellar hook-basal body protein n=1 Tax=Evansella clarkii TaxID=79879 RepID=UPI000B43C911|nr:flagellar hook-basal body protein [Evansella clarkii]